MPCSWLCTYSPVPGGSVAACRVTAYCIGESCAFHSASDLTILVMDRFSEGMVPGEGVEPSRCCQRRILSPLRLPFRHPGVLSRTACASRAAPQQRALSRIGAHALVGHERVFEGVRAGARVRLARRLPPLRGLEWRKSRVAFEVARD